MEIWPSLFKQDNSNHLSCSDKSLITATTLTLMWMEFIKTYYLWRYLLLLLVLLKDTDFIFFSSVETQYRIQKELERVSTLLIQIGVLAYPKEQNEDIRPNNLFITFGNVVWSNNIWPQSNYSAHKSNLDPKCR